MLRTSALLLSALFVALLAGCTSSPPAAEVDAGATAPDAGECPQGCPDGQACAAGVCYPVSCNGTPCPANFACVEGICTDRRCVGVTCGAKETCAAGTCYARDCTSESCIAGEACISGRCVEVTCADITCAADELCAKGSCQTTVCSGVACPSGLVCEEGRCVDRRCFGVICPTGRTCARGACSSTCDATFYEAGGRCLPKVALGGACSTDAACTSGHCADGVCCDAACTGACEVCAAAHGASADGKCGPAPRSAAGSPSCAPYRCDGASGSCPGACASSLDCAASAACVNGACSPVKNLGQPCGSGSECASGACADGVCCDKACTGSCDVCTAALGATADGVCSPAKRGAAGSPACAPYLCDGTSSACPVSCSGNGDCASGTSCSSGTCGTLKPLGTACRAAAECDSGTCADGVCCSRTCAGNCEACSTARGASADGVCTFVTGGGTPSCGNYVCSGASGTCPTGCTADTECAAGSFCASGSCAPKRMNGGGCLSGRECASGFCADGFCCDTACGGSCDACAASLGATADGTCTPVSGGGTPSCGAYLCKGTGAACPTSCTADAQCAVGHVCTAGACVPKRTGGAVCSAASECASGFCADGVCCDSACAGGCDVCTAALGASADGTCTKVSGAGSPSCAPYLCTGSSGACPTSCTADAECAAGNYCANGGCVKKLAAGTFCSAANECASGFCADGFCCDAACAGGCDACAVSLGATSNGHCTNVSGAGSPSCGPYVCSGTAPACPTSCTSDTQCAAGNYCKSNACVPKLVRGAACSTANECASGFCTSGVCCNTVCTAACEVCSKALGASADGTCTAAVSGATGAISGPSQACQNLSYTFSVTPVPNTTSYTWAYSGTGASGYSSGNASESITFAANATSGSFTVKATNSCGSGAASPGFPVTVLPGIGAPSEGTHAHTAGSITWKWNGVGGAKGYHFGTTSGFSGATDVGTATSFTESNLSCGTYTRYVFTDNTSCHSVAATLQFATQNPYGTTCYVDGVQIGTQCWMRENLNVGTQVTSGTGQSAAGVQKYCAGDLAVNCNRYGGLYEWTEIMNGAQGCNGTGASATTCATPVRGICPTGWHIPSHYEWTLLERTVDPGSTYPYDETSTGFGSAWAKNATNTEGNLGQCEMSGFGMPGGPIWTGTAFQSSNVYWTSSSNGGQPWYHDPYTVGISRYRSATTTAAYAVRCVHD